MFISLLMTQKYSNKGRQTYSTKHSRQTSREDKQTLQKDLDKPAERQTNFTKRSR